MLGLDTARAMGDGVLPLWVDATSPFHSNPSFWLSIPDRGEKLKFWVLFLALKALRHLSSAPGYCHVQLRQCPP